MTSTLTPPPAPRPVSMDLLRPQCLEVSRGTIRPPAAFSHRELPQISPATTDAQLSVGPEATYSNVGLAAIPRASLAASPVVWAGVRLTSSWARPGPETKPEVAEYARIHKLKGADQGPQGLEQGRAQGSPATQVKWAAWGRWVGGAGQILGRKDGADPSLGLFPLSRWTSCTPGSTSLRGGTQDLLQTS